MLNQVEEAIAGPVEILEKIMCGARRDRASMSRATR